MIKLPAVALHPVPESDLGREESGWIDPGVTPIPDSLRTLSKSM